MTHIFNYNGVRKKIPQSFRGEITHKRIEITTNVYGYVSEKLRKEVVETTDKFI